MHPILLAAGAFVGGLFLSGCSRSQKTETQQEPQKIKPIENPSTSAPPSSSMVPSPPEIPEFNEPKLSGLWRQKNCGVKALAIKMHRSDPSLIPLVNSVKFPELDMTVGGISFLPDSKGLLLSKIAPNNPVAWVKEGNRLYILTANKLENGAYAPATLFAYELTPDGKKLVDPSSPLPVRDLNGKAILLPFFKPLGMGPLEKGHGILFDTLINRGPGPLESEGPITKVDLKRMDILENDWCFMSAGK